MSEAKIIRDALILTGVYTDKADLEFLTDEYIENTSKNSVDITSVDLESVEIFDVHYWSGNHFYMRRINGVNYWYWEDTPGSQCGRTRSFSYKVNRGDSAREAGRCPQGYVWHQLTLNY